jgi:hypothetical protein
MVIRRREDDGCKVKRAHGGDGDKQDGKAMNEVKSAYRGDGGEDDDCEEHVSWR